MKNKFIELTLIDGEKIKVNIKYITYIINAIDSNYTKIGILGDKYELKIKENYNYITDLINN